MPTPSRLWRVCKEHVLGTRFEMLVNSPSGALAKLAVRAAREEIERLNNVLNDRRDSAEISKLNRDRRIDASEDLFAVLQLGETWRKISRGAFDGRMGELVRLWASHEPDRLAIDRALAALRDSSVTLDSSGRSVELSSTIMLSLDAVAKGYVVDAAFNAARRAAPLIEGLAVCIGGDLRCFGESPHASGWRIGIPNPTILAENAPLADAVAVRNGSVATSGRGPRDCTGNGYRSTTISPFTGRPVREVVSASVVASHAADADAIATACLVLRPEESIAWIDRLDGVAARITDFRGGVHESLRWQPMRLAAMSSEQALQRNAASRTATGKTASAGTKQIDKSANNKPSLSPEQRWPADWEVGVTYLEPEIKDLSAGYTNPYVAVWITDADNKPVSTVLLLGRDEEWHHDNFVWWGSYGTRAVQLVDLLSRSTSLSGRYQVYWNGTDDDSKPVSTGRYTIHLETNQEHGVHTYRSMPIEIGRERFNVSLPNQKEDGGLKITYGHYNEREY